MTQKGNPQRRAAIWTGAIALIVIALVLIWLFATPWSPLKRAESATPTTAAVAPTTAAIQGDTPMPKSWSSPPAMSIDPSKSYFATIKTEKGDIRVQLHADKAPNTVNSFVFLARQGFYDNTTFHRVISGFMAQGGDPTGTGNRFADEIVADLKFDAEGVVAMANAGANTNGSQFFITYAAQPHLNGGYSIFGKVVSGMDVAKAIDLRDPATAAKPGTKILTIAIEEK
jgi:cyclophilin family peptidyl-prolyl cis-trans isomerase